MTSVGGSPFTSRPRAVTCFVCGRQYGTSSIGIHIKSCTTMFTEQEARKPVNQRRPVPVAPPEFELLGGLPGSEIDRLNDTAFQSFIQNTLEPCLHCGRRFASDRLAVHNRSCTAESPARPVGAALPGGGGAPVGYRKSPNEDDDADATGDESRHSAATAYASSTSRSRSPARQDIAGLMHAAAAASSGASRPQSRSRRRPDEMSLAASAPSASAAQQAPYPIPYPAPYSPSFAAAALLGNRPAGASESPGRSSLEASIAYRNWQASRTAAVAAAAASDVAASPVPLPRSGGTSVVAEEAEPLELPPYEAPPSAPSGVGSGGESAAFAYAASLMSPTGSAYPYSSRLLASPQQKYGGGGGTRLLHGQRALGSAGPVPPASAVRIVSDGGRGRPPTAGSAAAASLGASAAAAPQDAEAAAAGGGNLTAVVAQAVDAVLASSGAGSAAVGAIYPLPVSGGIAPGGTKAKIAQLLALQEQVAAMRREFDRQLHGLEVSISRAVRGLLAE